MRYQKHLIGLCLSLCTLLLAAQSPENVEEEHIAAAKNLMAHQQYVKAFSLLQEHDPENRDLNTFKLMYRIAMDHNVSVVEYQHFGLKNHSAFDNSESMDLTKSQKNVVVIKFPINQILDTLLAYDSTNVEIHRLIVDFYYRVWEDTRGDWLIPESQLLDKLQFHYQFLLRNGVVEPLFNYMCGYVYFLDGEMDSAITYLQDAIRSNPKYGDAYYTLGLAYFYLRDFQQAMYYGEMASRNFFEEEFRANAFRLIGLSLWQMGDYESAYKAYIESDKLDRKNPSTIKLLLECMLALDHDHRILKINEYFNLDPANPEIYRNLNAIYTRQDRKGELLEFYNLRFESHRGNHQVLGNLYLYKGRLMATEDKKTAIADLSEANKHFSKIYDDNHPVFAFIQKSIRSIKL